MQPRLAAAAAAAILSLGAAACGGDSADPDAETARAPAGFFGVVPQTALTDDDLDRMAAGEVAVIRLVVPWGLVDPTRRQDDLEYAYVDPVVLGAARRGISILPAIYGSPAWVAEGLDGHACDPDCAAFAPRSDRALAAWKQFIGELVDRYGPDGSLWVENPEVDPVPVHSWQIWNEQNSPTFFQPEVDSAAYERMLAKASRAIKSRDPEAEVVLGGMFGTPFGGKPPGQSATDFLRELYSIEGGAASFDSVSAHPYAAHEAKIEAQVRLLHEEVERAGDDAGLWITEVGASSDEGDNPLERGPEGQAEQLRSSFEFFLDQRQALDIEGVTWYSWRDTTDPNQCDWCPGSGLFEADSLEPKPAWDAFVSFTGGS